MTSKTQPNPLLAFDNEQLLSLQKQYLNDMLSLWNQALQKSDDTPNVTNFGDKRFKNEAWANNAMSMHAVQTYEAQSKALKGMVQAIQTDAKTKSRIDFAVDQFLAASAPSNFLVTNAESLKKALDTQGLSLQKGTENLLKDIRKGYISMTDETQFELGKNIATTEGNVVFENDFFQLIEYKPLTEMVFERPFLFIPPCINKYYILDLQPNNSLIRYTVAQGHRTFVVSWCNPDASMAHHTWDDYIEHGVLRAIATVQSITQQKTMNALGFCVGGTLLSTALAVLAGRGEQPVSSLTLLTTLLDFSDTGILDLFVDEKMVHFREMQLAKTEKPQLLNGKELASTFSFLRPNDLVWNYVVGNYLNGESPPAFDLLYWNSDSTNLPGMMYTWYLRNTYHENNLMQPNKTTVCGQGIDLGKLQMPVYIYGSKEDHIVPPNSAYASTQLLSGKKRFVLGASGHIAGVINPPVKNKRSYWINLGFDEITAPNSKKRTQKSSKEYPSNYTDWFVGADEHAGSWWTDWAQWLSVQSGKPCSVPNDYGNNAIEAAPGRYVKSRLP